MLLNPEVALIFGEKQKKKIDWLWGENEGKSEHCWSKCMHGGQWGGLWERTKEEEMVGEQEKRKETAAVVRDKGFKKLVKTPQ